MSRYGASDDPVSPSAGGPGDYGSSPPSDPWAPAPWQEPVEPATDLRPAPDGGYPDAPYPAYGEPAYGEPAYGEPAYGEPAADGLARGDASAADPAYQSLSHPTPSPSMTEPGYAESRYADPSYPDPPYAAPPPPPAGSGTDQARPIGLYAVVAVLVVLAATGVAYALFLLSREEPASSATASTSEPTSTAPVTPEGSPVTGFDNLGMNAAMAQVEDCLVNDGTLEQPQLRIVSCDADADAEDEPGPHFQVLAIFNEQVVGEGVAADQQAQQICAPVEGYTHHYYEVGATSFVLCMAEQE